MNAKKKVPAIRFQGFSEEWEENKILNIAPLQRGFDLPKNDMKVGSYPVVMSSGISCYHSCYKVKGPGIVTGRSGTIGKVHYVAIDYWPHNTALWVTGFNGNFPLYIYYLYIKLDLNRFGTGSGVPTLNRNDVHDQYTIIPKDKKEQTKIGNFFQKLDSLISQQQKKHGKLQQLKKALLQKMFPQQGQSVPELRFQGFRGEWEEKELGEICTYHTSPLSINDAKMIGKYQLYDVNKAIGYTNYNVQDREYITIIKDGAGVGRLRLLPMNTSFIGTMGAIQSAKTDIYFLLCCLIKINFNKRITGSTIPHIYFRNYSTDKCKTPVVEEQGKIGNFFQKFDKLLSQQQAQLEKLRNIKKACLEKMFV